MNKTMRATVRARAPLRIGLAGGGSDVSPFCDTFGGSVVNVTIDRYAYATVRLNGESNVRFYAKDKNQSVVLKITDPIELSGGLILHRAVYRYAINKFNRGEPIGIDVITHCDAPEGSGLGSSSTLVVAMIKAFENFFGYDNSLYNIASTAYNIERIECGMSGGKQDQYSAAFGGLNFMEFGGNNFARVTPIKISDHLRFELESSLLLYFTGVSRDSAKIISDQSANIVSGNTESINAMHGLKAESINTRDCLINGDLNGLAKSMRDGWENKKRSAKSVSNRDIDEIYSTACENGAIAGKVSGAGGGGFMCFIVPCERRMDLTRALSKFSGIVSNCHFNQNGVKSWIV
jgi:D-glycero-alpha-D-manno-heptose-7-phosphate kinase